MWLPICTLMPAPAIVPIAWCVSDESAIQTYLIRHEYSKSVSRDYAHSAGYQGDRRRRSESCLLLLVVMRIGIGMGFMGESVSSQYLVENRRRKYHPSLLLLINLWRKGKQIKFTD